MSARAFCYPLQTESLATGLVFYAAFGIVFALYLFVRGGGDPQLVLFWLILSASAIFMYVGLLFGYGMEIVRATGEGRASPPLFSASISRIAGGGRQLLRQMMVMGFFSGFATQLQGWGLESSAIVVWILLSLMLPAFVIHNSFYESLTAMLNPSSLGKTLATLGPMLVPAMVLQGAGVAFVFYAFSDGLLLYFALFPCALYCQFLYFHVLGLRVNQYPNAFFTPVDFKADRAELEAVRAKLAPLDTELSEAFEWLRAGELARVTDRLDQVVKRGGWSKFEQIFGYISQWHSSAPALHLCHRYLQQAEALATPMRALELAQWCVGKEPAFTLPNHTLQALAERAVIQEHYRAVLAMIENHLTRHPDAPRRAQLLHIALGLAAEKLKDESSHARLKLLAASS